MRTPMNGILGMAELLGQSQLTPEQASQVSGIRACAADLLENVSDILDFARFESGVVRLKQETCDVASIAWDSVQVLRHFAHKKSLTLTCDISPQLPDSCSMDRSRFRQILLNLLRNGIKFTQEGSVHLKLFGAFQQADGALDRKFEGSGLGLSIVERITKMMGGTVQVKSELGKGSEFIILLPLDPVCPKAIAGKTDTASPHSVLNGVNVLLAEDNRVNQKIVQGFVKGSGLHLDVANDGNEAAQLFAQGRYDAVLMDVSMPNRNGFDATRAIRAMQPCPIIAYTANCGEDDQKKCYDAGMDDVLPKPASKQELSGRLAHWISRNIVSDEGAVAS